MNLLLVESSFRGENSASRLLTAEFMRHFQAKFPQSKITTDDLRLNPAANLDENLFGSWLIAAEKLTPKQQQSLQRANQIIASVKKADILVFGAPLYNFNIPASLKSWLDNLSRGGETFIYTQEGSKGLLDNNKKVIVLTAIGGIYQNENEADFQSPYLRHILAFNGLTDITFIKAQGLDMGAELREQGLNKAYQEIAQLVANL